MMNNKEIEIRFSDLLAMLLRAAKGILCFTLILGLLGAAYGAYAVIKAQPRMTQADVEAAERNVAMAEGILEKAQSSLLFHNSVKIPGAEEKVARAEQTVLQMQEHMKNSIYYGMNPFHRGAAELRFTVETDVADVANSPEDPRVGIVIAYTQMCPFDLETMDQLRTIMGGADTPLQYVEELVSVSSDEDHHVVVVSACHDDLETAEQMVDYLYQVMTARAAESLPKHQVKVLAAYKGYGTDWAMSENHATAEESLVSAEKALANANKAFQELQSDTSAEQAVADASNALNAAQAALQNAHRNRPSVKSLAKRTIKYGIICGFIGFVFGCFYALFKGLFGGVIQNQNEVMNRYAFPLIGVLPSTKKRWFDASIRKLEGEPTGSFDATAQATAQSLLARIGEKPICLVSSTGDEIVARKLSAYTDDALLVIGSIIDSADAVKELAKYEGIVLVEKRGKSRLDLVDAEVLRAKALNKEIVGIVLA